RIVLVHFFFSSRRRHTRFSRDWSSDVCSSDLATLAPTMCTPKISSVLASANIFTNPLVSSLARALPNALNGNCPALYSTPSALRSEERRVGKEDRSRCASAGQEKKTSTNRGRN